MWRKTPGDNLADESIYHQFYTGNKEPCINQGFLLNLKPPGKTESQKTVSKSRLRTDQSPTLNTTLDASQGSFFPPEPGGRPSKGRPDFSFDQLKNSLDFSQVDWSYFYSAQKSWSIKEKLEYMFGVIHNKFEKSLVRMQASYHLGYYMCKYKEMDKVECFSFIGKHMSMKHARCYRQLYRDLGCYRTLAHCTMPLRNIIARIKYVRNLIKSQTSEEKRLLMFPPNSDPYQFLKAYEEWYNLKESAVYQLGLPDNRCCTGVIEQYAKRVLTDVTKEGIWILEHFLNNSAEEDKYVLMYDKGSSGNCFLLQRDKSGKFSLEDDKLQCFKNIEPEAKVHLLTIRHIY
ncbi:hypothetical protein ACJMK2_012665 [Sinanodonta woodiana]|uniref:Uncharacterized protein n=1 Tax=Sinanodonta woodiana TaxID=1069815 RepID=A0ABD3V8Y1_SINWO